MQQRLIDIAEFLILRGADINYVDRHDRNALYKAINEHELGVAKFLIEHGTNLNHQFKNGITVLHKAVIECNLFIAKLLIEHGAQASQVDSSPARIVERQAKVANQKLILT